MQKTWLRASALQRHYQRGPQTIRAVDDIDLDIVRGEFLAIVGASGSGKSTLLNMLAGLDTPTGGNVQIDGVPLTSLSRSEIAAYRAHSVGMIFQSFQLIKHRSALQNVELALLFNGTPRRERVERARKMLGELGLADRLDHRPADLSGGEQQRVAVARALVKEPQILFADEPTGNLDRENSDQIAELLIDHNRRGLTVVLVTHDRDLAERCAGRVLRMDYGKLVEGDGE